MILYPVMQGYNKDATKCFLSGSSSSPNTCR